MSSESSVPFLNHSHVQLHVIIATVSIYSTLESFFKPEISKITYPLNKGDILKSSVTTLKFRFSDTTLIAVLISLFGFDRNLFLSSNEKAPRTNLRTFLCKKWKKNITFCNVDFCLTRCKIYLFTPCSLALQTTNCEICKGPSLQYRQLLWLNFEKDPHEDCSWEMGWFPHHQLSQSSELVNQADIF